MKKKQQTKKETAASGNKKRGGSPAMRWLTISIAVIVLAGACWFSAIEIALWRGAVNIEVRNHHSAMAWLNAASFLGCDRGELHYLKARCHRRLGQFKQVEHHLRKARDANWNVKQLQHEQWAALAQSNQWEEMSDHWADLFENAGSDGPEISKAYANMCFAGFQFAEADRIITAWEGDYPQDPEPHVMRGRLATTNLNWTAAAQHYEEALKLEPGRADATFGLATAQINNGRVESAEKLLRGLVAAQPDSMRSRLALAQCHIQLDHLEAARKELDIVIAAEPDNVEALLEAGNLELAADNPPAAAKHLRKALKLRPESREIAYAAARTLQSVGDSAEAAKLFKFVDKGTKPLIRLKRLTAKLLNNPSDIQTRFEVAEITWLYKSREEGASWLQSLLKYDPLHPPTHMALLKHYELNGDKAKAAFHRQYVEAAREAAANLQQQQTGPATVPLAPNPNKANGQDAKSNETKSNETKSDETKSDETKSDGVKSTGKTNRLPQESEKP